MPIVSAPAEGLSDSCFLGLGIKQTGADQRHCGIIYRVDNSEPRFLHLAFHYDLRDEALDNSYWWSTSGLDEDNQLILAAFANLVANEHPGIPYGFDAEGMIFENDTGNLKAAPAGRGLTCATFVLAVFRTYGFEPLQVRNWPTRAEDEQWKQVILRAMEDHGASQDHLNAIRSSEPSMRYRPEEVVGGSRPSRWCNFPDGLRS